MNLVKGSLWRLVLYVIQFVWALAGSAQGKVTECLALDYLIVRIHVPLECPPLTPPTLQFPPPGSARSSLLIGRGPGQLTNEAANERRGRAGRRVSGLPLFFSSNQPVHQTWAHQLPSPCLAEGSKSIAPVFIDFTDKGCKKDPGICCGLNNIWPSRAWECMNCSSSYI